MWMLIRTLGMDPFDHSKAIQTDYICLDSNINEEKFQSICDDYVRKVVTITSHKSFSWGTVIRLNVRTGDSVFLFKQFNPLRTRIEINKLPPGWQISNPAIASFGLASALLSPESDPTYVYTSEQDPEPVEEQDNY